MIEYSVLIYSRNHGPFIQECLDSVLQQSPPPEEVIVFDGGSTDGTLAVLRRYADRIRLIEGRDESRSLHAAEAAAVNRAFAASRGEIVFLLDGDDRFKPGKIEAYATAFRRHPDASVVQAPLDRIDDRGRLAASALEPRYHLTNHLKEIYRRQDLNFFYPTSALAFSRSYLERILPMDTSDTRPLWTDARLCLPAIYFGRIITLPDAWTDWRIHANGDVERLGSGWVHVRQIFLRTAVFNEFCRRHRLRTLSPWLNRRLYLQLARCALPGPVVRFYHRHLRPLLHGRP